MLHSFHWLHTPQHTSHTHAYITLAFAPYMCICTYPPQDTTPPNRGLVWCRHTSMVCTGAAVSSRATSYRSICVSTFQILSPSLSAQARPPCAPPPRYLTCRSNCLPVQACSFPPHFTVGSVSCPAPRLRAMWCQAWRIYYILRVAKRCGQRPTPLWPLALVLQILFEYSCKLNTKYIHVARTYIRWSPYIHTCILVFQHWVKCIIYRLVYRYQVFRIFSDSHTIVYISYSHESHK